ncbi:hypothetical protein LTS17_008864 [Exophiala oligosperma]
MSGEQKVEKTQVDDDDELDECAAEEQLRMNDCYYDKKDWRLCRNEVSFLLALRWSSATPDF